MEKKTLRIIFSGITTLHPGPPRNGAKPPDKAYVMMAATMEKETDKRGRQTSDWATVIADHFPFVQIAASLLVNPPWPTETVICEGAEHFIYFFQDARVVIRPSSKRETRIEYFIDPRKRPLADRPGSDDVAPPDDIRWLADLRDILSTPSPVRTNPAAKNIGNEVAAIVNLDGGTLRANFPCDTVRPRAFMDAKGNVVPGLRRALASEFFIDIEYPKELELVTLSFQQLRKDTAVTGPRELVLKWPHKQETLEVRVGNDTKAEVRRLNTPQRCDPTRETGPVLKPRDDEFDLHYNLLKIPSGTGRPLPMNDPHQCRIEGCKPAII